MRKDNSSPGRPREFDSEQALDAAMHVFWRKGFEGTSLNDLTTAMGISRPSVYAAFGNKEQLFLRVLERYRAEPASYLARSLEKRTALEVFEDLLEGAICLQTGIGTPPGCLFVHGALATSETSEPIRRELAKRRSAGEEAIRSRFEKAVNDGDLPRGTVPSDLARFTVTILHGMAVQAAGGDGPEALRRVATMAVAAFPE